MPNQIEDMTPTKEQKKRAHEMVLKSESKKRVWKIGQYIFLLIASILLGTWVFVNSDIVPFMVLHPNEVRVRKIVYDQATASGSAAMNEYLKSH